MSLRNPRLDSMRLVEEFMLAANEAVAGALDDSGRLGALSRPRASRAGRVEEFRDLLASFGYTVKPNAESTATSEEFQQILKLDRRQARGAAPLDASPAHAQAGAVPRSEPRALWAGHGALRPLHESHQTLPRPRRASGPARAAFRRGPALTARLAEALPEMGRHLSEAERRAAEAERELLEWKKVRFMAKRIGEVHSGYVTGVQAFGLFVELDDLFVQGLVHVSSMNDDYYRFNERAHLLKGENTRRTYRLGDRVVVKVARVDLDRRQAEFVLEVAAPKSSGPKARRRVSPRTRN